MGVDIPLLHAYGFKAIYLIPLNTEPLDLVKKNRRINRILAALLGKLRTIDVSTLKLDIFVCSITTQFKEKACTNKSGK